MSDESDIITSEESGRTLNDYAALCHNASRRAGWWDDVSRPLSSGEAHYFDSYRVATKLALIHSEVSEALEGHRKGIPDDKLPHRSMFEVELADALIRIFDLAGAFGLDLEGALREKMAYNASRLDHTREHREGDGGKKY